ASASRWTRSPGSPALADVERIVPGARVIGPCRARSVSSQEDAPVLPRRLRAQRHHRPKLHVSLARPHLPGRSRRAGRVLLLDARNARRQGIVLGNNVSINRMVSLRGDIVTLQTLPGEPDGPRREVAVNGASRSGPKKLMHVQVTSPVRPAENVPPRA